MDRNEYLQRMAALASTDVWRELVDIWVRPKREESTAELIRLPKTPENISQMQHLSALISVYQDLEDLERRALRLLKSSTEQQERKEQMDASRRRFDGIVRRLSFRRQEPVGTDSR